MRLLRMFINGQKLDGAVPVEEVRQTLDQALTEPAIAPPEHKAGVGNAKTLGVAIEVR